MSDVVIVGGGLSGLALGALLARQGIPVQVYEARDEMRDVGRSINLALSARGIRTLDALNMNTSVLQQAVPMYGRCIHAEDSPDDFQSYDLVGHNAIYSIQRTNLWQALAEKARATGVELYTGYRCTQADVSHRTLTFLHKEGAQRKVAYNALIGCDGVRSAVRRGMVEAGAAVEQVAALGHGYIELYMPRELSATLHPNALHIWPRETHMLVALPNTDGSFTATLFFPWQEGDPDGTTRPRLALLFKEDLASAVDLIAGLDRELAINPLSRLLSSQCRPWQVNGSVLLLGDAAHTMAPFYGQGMNCALEDCLLLVSSIRQYAGDWPATFSHFERTRRPDTDAIVQLSDENYREMSHKVMQTDFKERRKIQRELQLRHPDTCIPLYAMIAFTTLPYAEAVKQAHKQAHLIDHLVASV